MQRVHWSADYAEAHVVEAMLRAHGCNGSVFDAALVRRDWFKTLVFGGYRLMVPDEELSAARELISQYRSGALSLPDSEADRPPCPRCGLGLVTDDPRPRRMAFALLILSGISGPLILFLSPANVSPTASITLGFALGLVLPGVLGWLVKSRYRCGACGIAWRARRESFTGLTRIVEAAENTSVAR